MSFNPSDKKNILFLFDRPNEPLVVGKGDDLKVRFSVPADYLPDRYKPLANDLENRFSGNQENTIPIQTLRNIPDLSLPLSFDRRGEFSLFIPQHRAMATQLINAFMGQNSFEEFKSLGVYCRDRLNPYMFTYALAVAILHRNDCKDIPLPSFAEILPEKFMDKSVFARIKEEANLVDPGSRMPLEIRKDFSATDLDEEHRVAYFREDIGINLHHWHWHLVYPFEGPTNIVNKNRRGELFYYMHQQVLARYNAERLSNKLLRTRKFNNLREAIPEAYFSKLDQTTAGRTWPPRFKNARLSDINREIDRLRFELADLDRWRDRILEAVHTGSVLPSAGSNRVPLSEDKGIDILGNMVEASDLSVNKKLYGEVHNMGHLAIAYCHDPDNRYLESFGVMGDSTTAMRDPIFYRWHENMNDIFLEHKHALPPYTGPQLNFDKIKIKNVEVSAVGIPKNEFSTFWQQSDVNLSRGLDFTPRGAIYARFTHLQHAPFSIKINVENTGSLQRRGTVRIFLAPKFDEKSAQFTFQEQKNLFIELDRFVVDLNNKNNIIERSSIESSVTIPFDATFRDLETNRAPEGSEALAQFNFCGCGWPQHMLIPRGNAEGFPCQLFVMVSDYAQDRVDSPQSTPQCDNASSYCGVRDGLYPDRKAMGYPFDRMARNNVVTLQQFLTPNMAVLDVKIKFNDRIVARRPLNPNQGGGRPNQGGGRPNQGGGRPNQGGGGGRPNQNQGNNNWG